MQLCSCTPFFPLALRSKWPYTEWETGPTQKSRENGKENGNGSGAEMAEKWPPKWKNGPQNGIIGHFSISVAIFRPFRPGAIFHFLSHFPGIFASGRFPILYMATSIATLAPLPLINDSPVKYPRIVEARAAAATESEKTHLDPNVTTKSSPLLQEQDAKVTETCTGVTSRSLLSLFVVEEGCLLFGLFGMQ